MKIVSNFVTPRDKGMFHDYINIVTTIETLGYAWDKQNLKRHKQSLCAGLSQMLVRPYGVVKIEEKHEHKEHKVEHHVKAAPKEGTITITKTTVWKAISGVLGVLLVLSIFTGGFGITDGTTGDAAGKAAVAAKPAAAPSAPSPGAVDMKALADDDAFKGEADAPVTIVEFSDFECPYCGRFYSQTLSQIESQYIDTGKVKLVYRDFPLGFHTQAQKAAEAAECAGEQGKFWEMHDTLFEKGVSEGVSGFKAYAGEIGLDQGKFDSCLDNGDMAEEVQKDMRDGGAAGVRGTPGFIINGHLISGAQPFSVFQQAIEAALN